MNKTYVAVIIVVLVAAALFFALKSKSLEAPTPAYNNNQVGGTNNANAVIPATTVTTTTTTTTEPQPVKEFTVSGQNFSFAPKSLAVKKGDKVKISFKNTNGNHNFIIDEFKVNTGMVASGSQKTVEFTADKTGSFQYYCSVGTHRAMGMWGTLTVE
jgi:nitrosocyanin